MDKNTDSKDAGADGQKVVLVSMEGDRFDVPLKVAQMSDLVKTMVDPDELGASVAGRPRVCVAVQGAAPRAACFAAAHTHTGKGPLRRAAGAVRCFVHFWCACVAGTGVGSQGCLATWGGRG